jgi:hypothetical protein
MVMSPTTCVLGTTDLEGSVRFWSALGFVERSRVELNGVAARNLYGLDGATEVVLAMPDSTRGMLRLVSTPIPHPVVGPFDRGPHAIDLYTTDMDQSLAVAASAGADTSFGQLDYQFGPLRLREGKCLGPDGVILVFVDISRRRPSLLDEFPERLHSEVHSVVNIVRSVDEANRTWTTGAGLVVAADAVIDTPQLGEFLQLPTADRCRMSLLCDPEVSPIRFEQLGFIDGGADLGVDLATWPLPAGLPFVEFSSVDVSGTCTRLVQQGHHAGPIVGLDKESQGCSLVDGTGQRYFLR